MISASQLQRISICPGSAVLPRGPFETSPAAERGTAVHEYIAAIADGAVAANALALVPAEHQDFCAKIDVDAILAEATRDRRIEAP
jgi:hypothetical protein